MNDEALEALRAILPLAEAYLKGAPTHPDNAKLEDARALVRGHAIAPKGLTSREAQAIREAIGFRLSGETEDVDRHALETALGKL